MQLEKVSRTADFEIGLTFVQSSGLYVIYRKPHCVKGFIGKLACMWAACSPTPKSQGTFLLFIYFCNHFFIVVWIQLPPFSQHHIPSPHPPSPLTLHPSPLWLCPWVLYTRCLTTLPLLSPVISLPPLLWLLSVWKVLLHMNSHTYTRSICAVFTS